MQEGTVHNSQARKSLHFHLPSAQDDPNFTQAQVQMVVLTIRELMFRLKRNQRIFPQAHN